MSLLEPLLKKCVTISHIKQLQAHLLISGVFDSYPFTRAKFLDFCAVSAAGSLLYARQIFRHITFPVTNDWNAVIRGLAQSDTPLDAITLYCQGLRFLPCKPDALTCSFALKACARTLACNEAMQVHSQVVRHGFVGDVLLQTTLLDVYAKCGELDNACKLFDEMSVRDVTCWNAIIAGLAQGNRPDEALKLFKTMRDVGFKPNGITVLGALSACAQLGAVQQGENVYSYIRDQNLDMNEQVCNVVIDMFGKCGYVGKAYHVFNNMRCRKTIVTWNTMIMVLGTNGEGVEALQLFERMSKEGFPPDNVSYLAVLCACNHVGMVDEGVKLFETMVKDGSVIPNIKHYGTMVVRKRRSDRFKSAGNI
ncbi:pentatricopeptide repeat-containing protein [Tanacetum coccineum]